MIHKFKIGQIVDLVPMRLQAAAVGKYEIRQLMPASDIDSESPRYRVKSVAEKHERVVPESETLADNAARHRLFLSETSEIRRRGRFVGRSLRHRGALAIGAVEL